MINRLEDDEIMTTIMTTLHFQMRVSFLLLVAELWPGCSILIALPWSFMWFMLNCLDLKNLISKDVQFRPRPNFKAHSFLASLTKKLLKFKISGQNSNIFLGSQAIENSKTTGGTPWMFQFPRLGCPGRWFNFDLKFWIWAVFRLNLPKMSEP